MCIQNALQQHILAITNGGKTVADFLHATMQGETRNAKIHHQMEAAKQLTKLALTYTPSPLMGEGRDGGENSAHPEPVEGPLEGLEPLGHPTENCELKTENYPVTDIDIINYEIARLIRETTNDGFLIAEFLTRVMRGSRPGELEYSHRDRVISAADRMAAAKELLNRGFGRLGDSRRAARQDDSDLVQSGLARYIRERTEHGMEAVRLLLDVASGEDEQFSMHQRVVATHELMRRGWDINYDAITSADILAYYQRQDALEPTKYDIRLQEWREQERARRQTVGATGRSPEADPQPEAGPLRPHGQRRNRPLRVHDRPRASRLHQAVKSAPRGSSATRSRRRATRQRSHRRARRPAQSRRRAARQSTQSRRRTAHQSTRNRRRAARRPAQSRRHAAHQSTRNRRRAA